MTKISKEVALDELEKFVNNFSKKKVERSDVETAYPDVLDAICEGFVSFDENLNPTYKLKDPIKGDGDGHKEITFKTRILPTELAKLGKGLHPINDLFELQLKMTAHIIGQPVMLLDKFSRYDYDAINQIASVFS